MGVLGLMTGSWSDVNWGISDSCKPEMNVLSPLHIKYPFTPTKYIVLTCSFRTRSTWALEKENILWTFFYDRRLQRRNIKRKQQTDISGKKWRKPSVNFNIVPSSLFSKAIQSQTNVKVSWIAMPSWEKASCLHRCYASPLLLVTIAIEDGHWMVTGMGRRL